MNYIPHTEKEREEMLKRIGIEKIEDLFACIPDKLKVKELDIPSGLTEPELIKYFLELAGKNINPHGYTSFLGAGAYEHFIPAVVKDVISRGEFLTSYTPYQPEVSQGSLQAMYEYQSMITSLTGMDVANASLYDGATAVADAALVAINTTGRKRVIIFRTVHPEYRAVLATYLQGLDVDIMVVPFYEYGATDLRRLDEIMSKGVAAVIAQSPNFFGVIEKMEEISALTHQYEALFIAVVNPISLGLLIPPGKYNADIVVGEGQSLGNPLYFGGPYLGFFATTEKLMRKIPGRISGKTKDIEGKTGFVLTLQTREQHIRREKATSNICSNQALNALTAAVYLSALGPEGLSEVAEHCIQKTIYLKERIAKIKGLRFVFQGPTFHEFVVRCEKGARELNEYLYQQRIIGGFELERLYPELKNCLLLCVTETKTREDIDYLLYHLKEFSAL